MRIAVAGAGYVGLSIAITLAQNNEVALVDALKDKVYCRDAFRRD